MKIVIEGTPEECADAIQKLREAVPCTKVSTDGRAISAEFVKLYEPCKHGTPSEQECLFCAAEHDASNLPCPRQRPHWSMCPHCNGVNDAARAAHPATLELPAGVTSLPTVSYGLSLVYNGPPCGYCGGTTWRDTGCTVCDACLSAAGR